VVGTGGAQLTPLRFTPANSEARDNSTQGVLRLDLYDNGYRWEFIGVHNPDSATTFTDRGAASCH
jgi:hypothetical protein